MKGQILSPSLLIKPSKTLKNYLNYSALNISSDLLKIEDLRKVYEHIIEENKKRTCKVYFHELLENSDIILPENTSIPRNEQLQKRCNALKIDLENSNYRKMVKLSHEFNQQDTICYQLKEMNRYLIAIFQLMLSTIVGFAFGFIGVELITKTSNLAKKLLSGLGCAVLIGLADLYFLVKHIK